MTSKLKVNILADGGDNAILTSDGSGSLTLNNAALKNTPAFLAYKTSAQSIAHATNTQLQYNVEAYDTDSAYDTSTYKFTVPSGAAGKYYFYANNGLENTAPSRMLLRIRLNGSTDMAAVETGNAGNYSNICVSTTRTLSVGDYVDVTFYHDVGSTSNTTVGQDRFYFGGYKVIGA
tara:strand:+ start:470 stop:997 length:528 start_codon:yes stop_codon:yes gene_type:complete